MPSAPPEPPEALTLAEISGSFRRPAFEGGTQSPGRKANQLAGGVAATVLSRTVQVRLPRPRRPGRWTVPLLCQAWHRTPSCSIHPPLARRCAAGVKSGQRLASVERRQCLWCTRTWPRPLRHPQCPVHAEADAVRGAAVEPPEALAAQQPPPGVRLPRRQKVVKELLVGAPAPTHACTAGTHRAVFNIWCGRMVPRWRGLC